MTPSASVRWLSPAVVLASGLVLGVLGIDALYHRQWADFEKALSWSLLVTIVALVLGGTCRNAASRLPSRVDGKGFVSFVVAVELGLVLLVVPAFLLVWRTGYDDVAGWTYPFLNKRWVAALYGLLLATAFVFPPMVRRLLGEDGGAASRPSRVASETPVTPRRRRRLHGMLVIVLVVFYVAGPPWHLAERRQRVDWHEQVHLGPLQAITKGYIPYIGPASTQYGPGSQLLTYLYVKLSRQFTIVSVREASMCMHLITFLAVATLAYLLTGLWAALLVIVLAVSFSPLAFFRFAGDGIVDGFFGWGNSARYVGALAVVPTLAVLAERGPSRRAAGWSGVGVGACWGLSAWVSQENLSATLVGSGLLVSVLWLTETAPARWLANLCARVAVGVACVWVPILGYYGVHGEAVAFVRNYVLVPRAVAMGYSNTWWSSGPLDPSAHAFYYTPAVVVVLGVCTVWDVRTLRLRRPLSGRQALLFAFVSVLAACYQTALYRSDASHLLNTMIALPFMLVLSFRDLPGWMADTWPSRWAIRGLIVAAALWVYPLLPHLADPYQAIVKPAWAKFTRPPSRAVAAADDRIPFRRATAAVSDEPAVAGTTGVPMRKFLEDASALRDLIGSRPTYVAAVPYYYTGLLYFMLDLTPARFLFDRETMILNENLSREATAYFQAHAGEAECVITTTVAAPESQAFLRAHPNAVALNRSLGDAPIVVLIEPGSRDTGVGGATTAPRTRSR